MENILTKFEMILKAKRMNKADFCRETGINYIILSNVLSFLRNHFNKVEKFVKDNEHLLKG